MVFDKKTIHFKQKNAERNKLKIEVDILGDDPWVEYKTIEIKGNYHYHVFQEGFSAKWVGFSLEKSSSSCTLHLSYE